MSFVSHCRCFSLRGREAALLSYGIMGARDIQAVHRSGLLGMHCRVEKSVAWRQRHGQSDSVFRGQGEPFKPPQCYCWLREGRKNNAEVDFLTSAGPTVVPVEVKAGAGGSLRSLHQFAALRGSPIAVRFDLNQPSCTTSRYTTITPRGKKEAVVTLLSLPLYMAGRTREITSRHLSSGG
jgi:hypothetical protein